MEIIEYYKHPPDQAQIVVLAVDKAISGKTLNKIRSSIDQIVVNANEYAYEIFKGIERTSGISAINDYLNNSIPENIKKRNDLINDAAQHFSEYDSFFLSLSQSRKSRAGKTFENILKLLLEKCEIPFSFQPDVDDGRPDFIIPGRNEYLEAPQEALVLTAKRTVRERWRQITTEGARGFRFYLATIDENISKKQLDEMNKHQVSLLIPQPIIDKKDIYKNHSIVYSYKDLFNRLIPHCIEFWGQN